MDSGILGLTTVHVTCIGLDTSVCGTIVSTLPLAVATFVPGVCDVMFVVIPPFVSAHEYHKVGPPLAVHVNFIIAKTCPGVKTAICWVDGETWTLVGGPETDGESMCNILLVSIVSTATLCPTLCL